jgi:hypothetical protein
MLKLPKLNKGMKQPMTKIEKACKVIVGISIGIGLSTMSLHSSEAQAGIACPTASVPSQSSMLLTPSSGARTVIADHESHYSHSSHSSHYSHYSSRE